MLIATFNNIAVHLSWMIYGIVCWKHGKTYKLWSTQHMLADKLLRILVPVHPSFCIYLFGLTTDGE